jgi:hypothetical protein
VQRLHALSCPRPERRALRRDTADGSVA